VPNLRIDTSGAGDRAFCAAAMRYLRELIVLVAQTEDAREGISACFDERRPVWKGR
jgi:enoyl-CoA hydratase/carnithine racemase